VGRAIRVLALWRLERGDRIGVLDQLFGSTSVFQTVMTQINLRAYGWLGFGLAGLWILSPFGGQASLRIVDIGDSRNSSTTNLEYLSMFYFPEDPFTTSVVKAGSDFSQSKINAFYTSALVGSREVKFSSYDTWGNVKIPMLESIDKKRFPPGTDGWTNLASLSVVDFQCSNLIGIPVAGLPTSYTPREETVKFTMETSYWFATCPLLQEGRRNFELAKQRLDGPAGINLTSDFTTRKTPVGNFEPFSRPRRLNFYGKWIENAITPHYDYAECDLTTTFVEVDVKCSERVCTAVRMRPSKAPVLPTFQSARDYFQVPYNKPFQFSSNWTALDGLGSILSTEDDVFGNFSSSFASITTNTDALNATASPSEYYFLDEISPFNFNASEMQSLSTILPDIFGIRLAQLMNTFWLAAIGNEVITLGRAPNFLPLLQNPRSNLRDLLNTTAVMADTNVFICNRRWLGVLLLATSFVFFAGVVGIVLACISHAPVLAMNASTLLREARCPEIPMGGMALDDDERGRLLKDVKIRLGDMMPGESAGEIGIGALTGKLDDPASLDRRRFFL
jgi:hypothetical protein